MDDYTTNHTNALPADTAVVASAPPEPQICTVSAKGHSNAAQPSGTEPPPSGTRPAEKCPCPAPSGTLGTVFSDLSASIADDPRIDTAEPPANDGCGGGPAHNEELGGENLPDVPDGDSACRTGVPNVPDGCRTDAGPTPAAALEGGDGDVVVVHVHRVDPDGHDLPADVLVGEAGGPNPDASNGGADGAEKAGSTSHQAAADPHALVVHAPDKRADGDEPDADGSDGKCPLPVDGTIRMGCMHAPRHTFQTFLNPDLADLLDVPILPPDTVIEAVGETTVSIVDADTHTWSEPPSPEVLESYIATIQPQPDAAWISHGAGLKLIYIGPYHRDRALAAAFALPSSFSIEMLGRTRHPRSTSTAHPGRKCGKVRFRRNKVRKQFLFHSVGRLTAELRQQALRQLDMQDGQRYDHDRCPIDAAADTTAKDCVAVLEAGIYCHRCAGHGVRYRPHLPAAFLPFRLLVNSDTTTLDRLADDRVHWSHARLELRHHHPNIGQEILREAYRKTLEARWEAGDPRIPLVFDLNLDFVWGDGLWLDDRRFKPTKVDNDAASGLPYVLMVRENEDEEKYAVPNPVLRSKAKNRTPSGYTPIRPFRGISFRPNDGYIPLQVEPLPRHKIELLADPMPLSQALAALQGPFPRLDDRYLMACLAAGICADAALGQPPGLAGTGTSGSGKEQTIRLGASFVGDDVVKLTLNDSEEAFMRQLGVAITAGHRFLAFDEFGKTRSLGEKLKSILQISTYVTWRPLYVNRLVRTPVHAAFFYPCVRFPDFLTSSAEFLRRTRRVHLHRRVPNWSETSGGDTCAWRDRTSENAFIANSILTHVWRLCHEHGFRFL